MTWAEANQRYLVAAMVAVREHLDRHAAQAAPAAPSPATQAQVDAAASDLEDPAAIDRLTDTFGLSHFERAVLLLLAGVELDAAIAAACAAAAGDPHHGYPTFGLALGALPDAHWSALAPSGPLRYWKMVEIGPGDALTSARLRIEERILHYLTGIDFVDERLQTFVHHIPSDSPLPGSHQEIVERLLAVWRSAGSETADAVVSLVGSDPKAMARVAAAAAGAANMTLFRLRDADISAVASEREVLQRLWERDAVLAGRVLLIQHADGESRHLAARLADTLRTPVVLAGRDSLALEDRTTVPIDVRRPTTAEQRQMWQELIPARLRPPGDAIEAVVGQFDFDADRIRTAALAFGTGPSPSAAALWDAARATSRPRGETLAQRIDARATWADLVLPLKQLALLHQIAAQVRRRTTVYDAWGFGERESRGLGISALFTGRSGTGKTMAAEVLANELALDLYRIDLSSVVSKYIGETEKNLRRVFDDAESGGSILLFDEADALFGKRSEVKDSHDRYANIEVSYLLQRVEAYRGLAILTTNLRDALDPAFLRRIRFVIDFPHPDRRLREQIWGNAFPAATPVGNLEVTRLGQLSVAGGNIRNVALNAAFMAADDGAVVTMRHLANAARDEFGKLDRTLSEEVVREWS